MKRLLIILFITAGVLDYLSYQGHFDKNKLYISYQEDGEIKEKRYYPKEIQLHIEIECPSYSFYRVRLRNPDNVFLFPDWVSGKYGKPYYQSYSGLKVGNYNLEMIDNFGIRQNRSIEITENRILSYDDIMNMFYPQQGGKVITNKLFTKNDTIRFNITTENIFCSGYNGMLYTDSLEILTLELFQKNNASIEDEFVNINVFKLSDDFLLYLNSLGQELDLEIEEKNLDENYEIFELIFGNRRVYYIPDNYSYNFKDEMIDMINKFSYKNEWKNVSRY